MCDTRTKYRELLTRNSNLMHDIEHRRARRAELLSATQTPQRDEMVKRLTEEITARIKALGRIEDEIEQLLEEDYTEGAARGDAYQYDPEADRPGMIVCDSAEEEVIE